MPVISQYPPPAVRNRPTFAANDAAFATQWYKTALRPGGKYAAWRDGCLMPQTKFWAEMTWTDFRPATWRAPSPSAGRRDRAAWPASAAWHRYFIMQGTIAKVVERRAGRTRRFVSARAEHAGFRSSTRIFPARSAFRPNLLSPAWTKFANACIAPAAASWFF